MWLWHSPVPAWKRKSQPSRLINVISVWLLCVCVQVGKAAWKSSLCAGAEHYGGLPPRSRNAFMNSRALCRPELSSTQKKTFGRRREAHFPILLPHRSPASLGRLPKPPSHTLLSLSLSLSPFHPVPLHHLPYKLPRVFHQPLRNQRPFHSSNRLFTPGPTSTFL